MISDSWYQVGSIGNRFQITWNSFSPCFILDLLTIPTNQDRGSPGGPSPSQMEQGSPSFTYFLHDAFQKKSLVNPNHNLYPNKTILNRYNPAQPLKVKPKRFRKVIEPPSIPVVVGNLVRLPVKRQAVLITRFLPESLPPGAQVPLFSRRISKARNPSQPFGVDPRISIPRSDTPRIHSS